VREYSECVSAVRAVSTVSTVSALSGNAALKFDWS